MKRFLFLAAVAGIGAALGLVTSAAQHNNEKISFDLVPASSTIQTCLPNASAHVTVFLKDQIRGLDTLEIKADGLPPNTSFSVFLLEEPSSPFGAAQYIADFDTNAAGRGSQRVDAVIEEAFSSTLVGTTRIRKELNHVGIWFSDPTADDFCFAPGTGQVTPFDGDGQAGVQVLSSRNALPGAPLP